MGGARVSTRRRSFGQRPSEKGYILALAALLLIPLLAFTGFATDVGSWYARASRLQRVADAASLAGVVWQPSFEVAEQVALETAERNGLEHGEDGIEITVEDTGPRQLRVEIVDTEVEVYFTSIFFEEIELTRDATAEYLQSLPMGSPQSWLGNDPVRAPVPDPYPNFWLNIGANNTEKVQGDRYTNGSCDGDNAPSNADTYRCDGDGDWGDNLDYEADGYFYAVEVQPGASGTLRIQLFDPAFTEVGSTCGSNRMSDGQMGTLAGLGENTMNDALTRYDWGAGTFCTGDSDAGGGIPSPLNSNQGPQNTSYMVREPDNTPFDATDNPVRTDCSMTFTGRSTRAAYGSVNDLDYNVSSYPDGSSAGGTGIYNRLRETSAHNDGTVAEQGYERIPFREHYRQWYTLCSVTDYEVGDIFYVQVRSNGLVSNSTEQDVNNDRGGHNRFSLRAGFGSGTQPTTAGVAVHAEGKLPIYVNAPSQGTTTVAEFFLARIDERYQGAVLSLDFFDIGDTSGSVAFLVAPPEEATTTSGSFDAFTNCTIERDLPGEPDPGDISGCGVTGMDRDDYQGRAVNVQVPIPSDYDCNEDSNLGCWIKVRMIFTEGAQPTDQTTWTASILGDPVRLIE
jgi:hypothetical protein